MPAAAYAPLPRERFVFSLIGSAVYERFFDLDQEEAHRRLAYDLDRFWHENDVEIGKLRRRRRRGSAAPRHGPVSGGSPGA